MKVEAKAKIFFDFFPAVRCEQLGVQSLVSLLSENSNSAFGPIYKFIRRIFQ